jgi:hypothetical protein
MLAPQLVLTQCHMQASTMADALLSRLPAGCESIEIKDLIPLLAKCGFVVSMPV